MLNTLTSTSRRKRIYCFNSASRSNARDKKETLPDSTITDAELSEPQDKTTSHESDGSILDGTTSESVEGNRTNLINQTTDSRNSPFIRRSSRPRRTSAYLEDDEHH
ncbi:hypothetical protein HHI36_015822 [Cryptolaemus montrouzieri]|uniref:Uncharacterized protein n=1 Tax=Cryptolaemus montrouzieri TaxID=559131 RepID=A0ABD2N751_9CUCU